MPSAELPVGVWSKAQTELTWAAVPSAMTKRVRGSFDGLPSMAGCKAQSIRRSFRVKSIASVIAGRCNVYD
jgi:hypothetical protein